MEKTELGPVTWDQFVGQVRFKRRLQIHIRAAFEGQRPLEHVLLTGPPGFGKSTLARLIADALTDPLTTLVMPMQRKALIYEIAHFRGGVLFLDEIHALGRRDQELLLPVLDRGVIVDDKAREYGVGWVTVIAATTERDKIIGPLHDRFTIRPDFEPYTDSELGEIVLLMAEQSDVALDEDTAMALGRASGGVPRTARQFVLAARDLEVTLEREPTVNEILDLCVVDPDGLTGLHQQYLRILADQRGQAGQKTVETLLRLPAAVVRDLERLLLTRGLIEYTASGRQLTPDGGNKVNEVQPYVRR